jgi:hypothetical protein
MRLFHEPRELLALFDCLTHYYRVRQSRVNPSGTKASACTSIVNAIASTPRSRTHSPETALG